MGKWSDQHIENNLAHRPESTANNCQKPAESAENKILSAFGSGLGPVPEKKSFSQPDEKTKKCLNESTDKTAKTSVEVLRKFIHLAWHYGTDHGVLLESSEVLRELDEDGIRELRTASLEARQSWAEAVALRLIRYRGLVPTGWTKTAHCQICGPVYSYHDLHMSSCDWCDMRVAGKSFPQPSSEEQTG